jgi:undecaprenyl-diphosphatase
VDLQAIDEGTSFALHSLHRAGLNDLMVALTHLGDESVVFSIATMAALLLAWRRGWRSALILVTVGLTAYWLTSGTKLLIPRKRPDLPNPIVQIPASRSFPSGHALNSAAVYMSIALMVTRRSSSRLLSIGLLGGTLGIILLIGFSRMYLCVHWLSDVLAGLSAGLGLSLLALWADKKWNLEKPTNVSSTGSS